ncbi:hypothetical protein [Undibacterium umbellatum]|uniref:Uncharacterized protein n=1 Tax=Undibacterium umbellatum TaxID=2762300 RepID=A0ABR6Z360_9BURK|nr:hypothetical protein [Undibacterium umbellatum]MBC3906210.1 hypothetical protein [Undibacterium umbellatum]
MGRKSERKSVLSGALTLTAEKTVDSKAPGTNALKSIAEQAGLTNVVQALKAIAEAKATTEAQATTEIEESPVVPRPRSVDAMSHVQLKEYAAEIGIQQRDIDGLTEDRLRQNCKARIFTSMEDE